MNGISNVCPHKFSDMIETVKVKKEQIYKTDIRGMFDGIASHYDFINNLLSFGTDKYWRKTTIKILKKKNPVFILDIATGTAELAIMAAKVLKPQKIVGIDISNDMLEIGRQKVKRQNFSSLIELRSGNAISLPFDDNSFDAVTIGFGIRNFTDLSASLKEIKRVLRTNGVVSILEFSKPESNFVKKIFNLYASHFVPFVGNKISNHKYAYNYLNQSIDDFPSFKEVSEKIHNAGFVNIKNKPLTFGITNIYTAEKK
ncbi:MAG: bifunctional demethylmenaquinone methyltransferase/2-methoxy-6-polyprenyl-1,4-benzoquinol methylase UbiE [Bacteroidales bacterium]|nr:bifunctional demethylmenaquinone methyltransferase/2-methoxy-6-polyprenyl-1,4-benzoquinol methylase UbiE [Bacteroidales bacterium]